MIQFYEKNILPLEFYDDETSVVAQKILGKHLVRILNNQIISGRIVEVEAYLPFEDAAAHNYVGKTARNSVLFGEAGYTYIHSMRQYHCLDIVTEGFGRPGSVLIRALEPMIGIDL